MHSKHLLLQPSSPRPSFLHRYPLIVRLRNQYAANVRVFLRHRRLHLPECSSASCRYDLVAFRLVILRPSPCILLPSFPNLLEAHICNARSLPRIPIQPPDPYPGIPCHSQPAPIAISARMSLVSTALPRNAFV